MNVQETLSAFERGAAGPRRGRQPVAARRAVGYVRVSTDEQQVSPEAQEAAIRSYAGRHGLEVVQVVHDVGTSGGAPLDERPRLVEALEALAASASVVLLVAKRDRLARDALRALFVERLVERSHAKVESADGVAGGIAPEDRLLRTLLDAVAEYERAAIRMRTRTALAAKRRRGEVVGQAPYGFRGVDGRLAAQPAEQAAMQEISRLRGEGLSWAEITDALNRGPHAAVARGKRWHPTTVQRIYRAEVGRRGA